MFAGRLALLLCLTYGFVKAEFDYGVSLSDVRDRILPDVCYPDIPKGRVPWIIYHRLSDYGWKEHTHRANIALAVNGYRGNKTEMDMMELQLEVEIANAILGNKEMHDNDLALFIHALVANNKNPRNFHGKDLVADLLVSVDSKVKVGRQVHPFLVLALCNSNAVKFEHLINLKSLTKLSLNSTEELELKALTLKAYACAADLGKTSLDKFGVQMVNVQKHLSDKQAPDGSFGNAYTTALVVQALIASPERPRWEKNEAITYLLKESVIKVNMIKAYYIELALNAESVKFIKDLYNGPPIVPGIPPTADKHFLRYTVRSDVRTHIHHTITIHVDKNWALLDVMKRCEQEGPAFKFQYYENKAGLPMIYSVSDTPNDAEENMFWRICLLKRVRSDPPTHTWETKSSPEGFKLEEHDDITLWYRDSDCSTMNRAFSIVNYSTQQMR